MSAISRFRPGRSSVPPEMPPSSYWSRTSYPALGALASDERFAGPLASVHDHRDDGRRGTIYYRPPNEATLIYTPAIRQIEVCADSPVVRQGVAGSFAEKRWGTTFRRSR